MLGKKLGGNETSFRIVVAKSMPVLLTVCALLLWGSSLPTIDLTNMSDYGLLSVLPLPVYAALALLVVSFGLALYQHQVNVGLWHVVVLIVFLHGTPVLLYGTLRYSWAWKHIGVVDYILRHGSINPNIPVLDAYHNWPGFFTLSAFLTQVAGLDSPLSFAGWAPVFFHLAEMGALMMILSALTSNRRLMCLGLWFYYLANWVGQDYFAPQALSNLLHLVILGICLHWFGLSSRPSDPPKTRWTALNKALAFLYHFVKPDPDDAVSPPEVHPVQRVGLVVVVVLLYAAVASSHQLTPFMTINFLALLAVFRRTRLNNMPVLMAVLAVTWIIYGATVFMRGEIQDLIDSFGQVTDNFDSNFISLALASPAQRIVALMGRGLTVLMWVIAFLGGIRRLRLGYWDLTGVLLVIAPFLMLFGNSYGGEILFRIYLFSLPAIVFFAAALLYPALTSGTSWRTTLIVIALSGALLTGFGYAHLGKDEQYHFTKDEVAAAQFLYSTAPEGSMLIEGSRNYPTQFKNYDFYTYVPISREPEESRARVLADPVQVLSRWMDNDQYTAVYLIITRSQKAEIDAIGEMPAGSLERIEQALLDSPKFEAIYANQDATVFVLAQDAANESEDSP